MTIAMTVVTTSAQILDTNGVNGFGTVTVTPSQAFTYYDGAATISVTNNSIVENVTNGKLDNNLVLSPTSNATNAPEVYYIVDIRVNGTYKRLLWSLPAPASTTEFSDVAVIASGSSVDSAVSALLQAANPFPQYFLRSDSATTLTASAASDGLGLLPRCDPVTGFIPKAFIFGGSSAVTASDIPIVDAGGIYTATEVEGALQEVKTLADTNQTNIAAKFDKTGGEISGNTEVLADLYIGGTGAGALKCLIFRDATDTTIGTIKHNGDRIFLKNNDNNCAVVVDNTVADSDALRYDENGTLRTVYHTGNSDSITKLTSSYSLAGTGGSLTNIATTVGDLSTSFSLPAGTWLVTGVFSVHGDTTNDSAIDVFIRRTGGSNENELNASMEYRIEVPSASPVQRVGTSFSWEIVVATTGNYIFRAQEVRHGSAISDIYAGYTAIKIRE